LENSFIYKNAVDLRGVATKATFLPAYKNNSNDFALELVALDKTLELAVCKKLLDLTFLDVTIFAVLPQLLDLYTVAYRAIDVTVVV